jgi:predicted RNase H-like HicB family nuclease
MRKAEAIAARYQLVLWREDGHWFGYGLEMPGCMGDGKTLTACERVTRRSIALGVATMLEQGENTPVPVVDQERGRMRRAG